VTPPSMCTGAHAAPFPQTSVTEPWAMWFSNCRPLSCPCARRADRTSPWLQQTVHGSCHSR
jgi:hypothetical protein